MIASSLDVFLKTARFLDVSGNAYVTLYFFHYGVLHEIP
jgi:hypothetical protein